MIIDSREYDLGSSYSNSYENSTIRQWLNDNFYNTAFSDLQKQIIMTTTVDNSVSSTGFVSNRYSCNNTSDKVFLLSYSEVINSEYGFSSTFTAQDAVRQKKASDYAKAQGANVISGNPDGCCNWWLRSPHTNTSESVRCVKNNGDASYNTYVYYTSYGVVPAIQIQL